MSSELNADIAKQELQMKVFNLITQRMKTLCVYTQDLTVERVNFLNPNYHPLSTEHTSITMGCNFNIDDQELAKILHLTEVTDENESMLDHSGLRCYIKSFTIKNEVMHALVSNWQEKKLHTNVVNCWLRHLQQHPDRDFHLRYIGQRKSNTSKRRNDFSSTRPFGFVKRFFDSLNEITGGEESLENYRYFYVNPFSPSTPGYNIHDIKTLNEHEQMLISFFGVDNVLNVQTGGVQASYDPGQEAFKNYLQLPTRQDFFRVYRALNQVNAEDARGGFKEWIDLVVAGANAVTSRPALSDSQLELTYNQAVPKYVDYFFSPGYNNTGTVLCNHLARLEAWQEGVISFQSKPFADVIPFLNVLPWTTSNAEAEALQEGVQQMNCYMRITLPLITVSISNLTTKFCFSNFIHPYGSTPPERFISDVVGIPKRVFIHDVDLLQDRNVKEMPQENSTIVIPHIHPGIDKHTARDSTSVGPITDLTWQITLFIAQMAMTFSNQYLSLSREQLVAMVADQCLPGSPQLDETLAILYARLVQAKNKYELYEQERNAENHRIVPKESTSATAARLLQEGRFEKFGLAQGQPYSSIRSEQVDVLWKTNFPNLHLHIGRERKNDWFTWMLQIKEGRCLAACVWHELSVADKPSRNYATLKRFRPENESDGQDDDWMNDPLKVAEANKRWHESIAPTVPNNHFSSEAQSKRRKEFVDSTYVVNIEGSLQLVQKQVYFMIFWRTPENEQVKFKIYLKFLVHKSERGQVQCMVNFVPEGIKVTTEDGSTGLYDLIHIKGHSDGNKLLQLWGMERERITGHYPQEAIVQTSNLPPGRSMIKVFNDNAREKFRSIEENDSVVILKAYLDMYYPQGGTLCFMQPEHFDSLRRHYTVYSYDTFIDSYNRFLSESTFKTHPLYTEHLSWIQNPKYIRYFMENIKLLRPGVESKSERVKLISPKGKVMNVMMLSFK